MPGSVSVDSLDEGAVRLDDGRTIECDLVVAATGSNLSQRWPPLPASKPARVESSSMRRCGHRPTNVYAAGDVALAYNSLAGRPVAVEHWQDAVDQGEIAGAGAAGQTREWDAVPGFWTTIGEATLKYHAWGDGFDRARLVDHDDGFTVWYERERADSRRAHLERRRGLRAGRGIDSAQETNTALSYVRRSEHRCERPPTRRRRCRKRRSRRRSRGSCRSNAVRWSRQQPR